MGRDEKLLYFLSEGGSNLPRPTGSSRAMPRNPGDMQGTGSDDASMAPIPHHWPCHRSLDPRIGQLNQNIANTKSPRLSFRVPSEASFEILICPQYLPIIFVT